uniref:Gag-pol protein n=1 Tax=Solanum tuberosum TaxID=4113 RepID=M1DP11_SOLTU
MDGCLGCGKSGHKMRDCPMLTAKGRQGKQAPPIGLDSNAPKQNRFYALQTRGEQEGSPDVVTDVLLDPFYVSTPVSAYVVAKKNRVVKFQFLNEPILERKGRNFMPKG